MNKVTVAPLITGIRKVESSAEFQRMLEALKCQQKAKQRVRQIDHIGNSRTGDLNALRPLSNVAYESLRFEQNDFENKRGG